MEETFREGRDEEEVGPFLCDCLIAELDGIGLWAAMEAQPLAVRLCRESIAANELEAVRSMHLRNACIFFYETRIRAISRTKKKRT